MLVKILGEIDISHRKRIIRGVEFSAIGELEDGTRVTVYWVVKDSNPSLTNDFYEMIDEYGYRVEVDSVEFMRG